MPDPSYNFAWQAHRKPCSAPFPAAFPPNLSSCFSSQVHSACRWRWAPILGAPCVCQEADSFSSQADMASLWCEDNVLVVVMHTSWRLDKPGLWWWSNCLNCSIAWSLLRGNRGQKVTSSLTETGGGGCCLHGRAASWSWTSLPLVWGMLGTILPLEEAGMDGKRRTWGLGRVQIILGAQTLTREGESFNTQKINF